MPLVRISLRQGKPLEYRRKISEVIQTAISGILKAPSNDRFHLIQEFPPENFIYDPSYFDIQRGDDLVIIEVTLSRGRSIDQKERFFQAVADGLAAVIGLRREDVFVVLTEVEKENWTFGNGRAQYAGVPVNYSAG